MHSIEINILCDEEKPGCLLSFTGIPSNAAQLLGTMGEAEQDGWSFRYDRGQIHAVCPVCAAQHEKAEVREAGALAEARAEAKDAFRTLGGLCHKLAVIRGESGDIFQGATHGAKRAWRVICEYLDAVGQPANIPARDGGASAVGKEGK